ncbi:MAG: UbiA family prenyltransferase [Phycisphaerae bacterium]
MKSRVRVYFELARVPNSVTASADSLAGYLIVAGSDASVLVALLLMLSSFLLYAGGVILNDVADVERDRLTRPDRPIPAGRISLVESRTLAVVAMLSGVVLACLASLQAGFVSLLVVASIVSYDVVLKQTALAPSAMGFCRGFNLLMGAVALEGLNLTAMIAATVMWLYVTSLTLFARREDEGGHLDNLIGGFVGVCTAVVAAGLLGLMAGASLPMMSSFVNGGGFAAILLFFVVFRGLGAIRNPEPLSIQRAVKTFVLGIVFLDAAMVAACRGYSLGLLVLALFVPARLLASRFRVT